MSKTKRFNSDRRHFFMTMLPGVVVLTAVFLGACGPAYQYEEYEDKQAYLQRLQELHKQFLNDDTVLAVYSNKKQKSISRNDLVTYAERNYGLQTVVGSVNHTDTMFNNLGKQKNLIHEIVERDLLVSEAKHKKLHELPEIKKVLDYARHKLLIPIHFRKVIAEEQGFGREGARVEHIFFRFPRTMPDYFSREDSSLPEVNKRVLDEARSVLNEIRGGELTFKDAVRKYSKDYTKKKGGELGWIVPSSMGKAYWNAVSRLATGQISDPVITETGIYLVRLLEKTRITDKNYKKLLHGRFAWNLKESMEKNKKAAISERLYNAPDVMIRYDLLKSGGNPDTVLARIGDTYALKLGDFEDEFKNFVRAYKPGTFSEEKLLNWKKRFLRKYLLTPRLIIRDALRRGLKESPEYKEVLKKNKDMVERVLFLEMKEHIFKTGPGPISMEKVEAFYNKYVKTRYFRRKRISPEEAEKYPDERLIEEEGQYFLKEIIPFSKVPAKMRKQVIQDLRFAYLKEYLKTKKEEAGFKILDDERFIVVRYAGEEQKRQGQRAQQERQGQRGQRQQKRPPGRGRHSPSAADALNKDASPGKMQR